ncbi:hypothetical protein IAR55_002976 [Kwoniella newhampshirensis]|uniref:CAP-Gly domain-containing protein n=1 Tax=Kwoniella newhampshirensis TaxID=1651941 RepID=A0AAW0Z0F6_9TREE
MILSNNEAGPSQQSSANSCPYKLNHRYLHAKSRHPLTLRYIGPLPPVSTTPPPGCQIWLGVEYDDPAHGKGHSGTYKDIQVFTTREEASGAFVRFAAGGNPPLAEGMTLVESIEERYGRIIPDTSSEAGVISSSKPTPASTDEGRKEEPSTAPRGKEGVILGSSSGAIVVEAPNIGGVKDRCGKLEKLRNMGFEDEAIRCLGGDEEVRQVLRKRLKGLKWLNLSRNLIQGWEAVAEIVDHLEGLEILTLNHSRYESFPADLSKEARERYCRAFIRFKELHLSDCLISWDQICRLGSVFQHVEVLYLEANRTLNNLPSILEGWHSLKELKLGGCPLSDWAQTTQASSALPSLQFLDLSYTDITTIPELSSSDKPLQNIQSLTMLDSRVSTWTDIDNLSTYMPNVSSLRFSSHPTVSAPYEDDDPLPAPSLAISGHPKLDRSIFIATLPNLVSFNSTPVSSTERRDSELFYISYVYKYISERGSLVGEGAGSWGRYEELCKLHGRETNKVREKTTKDRSGLRAKMITIHIYTAQESNAETTLTILPSSTIILLQRKVARLLGIKASDSPSLNLWTVRNGKEGEREKAVDVLGEGGDREVGWWFNDGDGVIVEQDNS